MPAPPTLWFRAAALAAVALVLTAAGCRTTAPPDETAPPPAATVTTAPAPSGPPPAGPPTAEAPPAGGRVAGPGVGAPLTLTLGQSARREGQSVRFVEVVEDSRCPADVTCVWEGRAKVAVEIGGRTVTLTVPYASQRDDEPSMIELGMLAVEVVGLDPYPGTPEAEAGAPPTLRVVTRHAGV